MHVCVFQFICSNLCCSLMCLQKTVLDSIAHDDPTYKGDGYTSLAVIYAVLAVCNWMAPSIISVTGPKVAMIIGAVTYA
jgi:Ion channel regulatory protein UNC-93